MPLVLRIEPATPLLTTIRLSSMVAETRQMHVIMFTGYGGQAASDPDTVTVYYWRPRTCQQLHTIGAWLVPLIEASCKDVRYGGHVLDVLEYLAGVQPPEYDDEAPPGVPHDLAEQLALLPSHAAERAVHVGTWEVYEYAHVCDLPSVTERLEDYAFKYTRGLRDTLQTAALSFIACSAYEPLLSSCQ